MLYENELVIDDSTPDSVLETPEGFSKGFSKPPSASYGAAVELEFPKELLIPRHEWQARIEEREERGLQLSQRMIKAGLPCKDQGSTNYCWGNAVVHAAEIVRVLQNEPMVILSPASVCAVVTNFRNVGGWDNDAIEQLASAGAVPVDQWPANAIDRRYHTKENISLALKYRVEKWLALAAGNIEQRASLLLRGIPVPSGWPWWEHETTGHDLVFENGEFGFRDRNSWSMKYGKLGFFVIQGNKMRFNTAVAPLSMLAS